MEPFFILASAAVWAGGAREAVGAIWVGHDLHDLTSQLLCQPAPLPFALRALPESAVTGM